MSNGFDTNWNKFWAQQATPCHAVDDAMFYASLAREVLFHTGTLGEHSVLELGCGNGAVSCLLGIDPDRYTGVDFSASLLAQFHTKDKRLELIQQDALGFLRTNTRRYDVILSFGMLQYLNRRELAELFRLQMQTLSGNGQCAHFGIPVTDLSDAFYSGLGSVWRLGEARRRGFLKRMRSRFGNRIGHWYALDTLHHMSRAVGFETTVVPNLNYFYRINLLQRLPPPSGGTR